MLEEHYYSRKTCGSGGGLSVQRTGYPQTDPPVFKAVNSFERAPLIVGDHVHSLPYWSRKITLECTPYPFTLRWEGGVHKDGIPDKVPHPSCDPGSELVSYTHSREVDCERFIGPVPSSFTDPKVTSAQWKFLEDMADMKALADLNKSLVNLPMLYKERRETLKMVGNRLGGLVRVAHAAQDRDLKRYFKARRKDRRKVAEEVANGHLELIFGWLPLIGELEGAIEYAELPDLDFIRCHGLHTLVLQSTPWDNSVDVRSYPNWERAAGTRITGSVRTRGVVESRASVRTALRFNLETSLAGDARRLGFEPISTTYDMIPLSFVVGWFSNFDKYVRTLAPLIGVTFETGSRNRRTTCELVGSTRFYPRTVSPPSGWFARWKDFPDGSLSEVSGLRRTDIRSVLSTLPDPDVRFHADVGLFEISAGISLLAQRYLKPLQRLLKRKSFFYGRT
uniref:Maturation protein A n=1 Tax=Pseudomonas phage PP7 TaxID=12023 RepID=MATA_BPPP7|nr:RecName: Full=Maturation protein A; Short=MP; AltName: Full=Assembly protein; Short=A protein [Pseudomonas phage PP7]